MKYKIKGTGENRTVHDADGRLVGRLVRYARPVVRTQQVFRDGAPVSATITKTFEVWWRAHDSEGRRLGRRGSDLRGTPLAWKGASHSTLKAWQDPAAWEGLETSGEAHVDPVPTAPAWD